MMRAEWRQLRWVLTQVVQTPRHQGEPVDQALSVVSPVQCEHDGGEQGEVGEGEQQQHGELGVLSLTNHKRVLLDLNQSEANIISYQPIRDKYYSLSTNQRRVCLTWALAVSEQSGPRWPEKQWHEDMMISPPPVTWLLHSPCLPQPGKHGPAVMAATAVTACSEHKDNLPWPIREEYIT